MKVVKILLLVGVAVIGIVVARQLAPKRMAAREAAPTSNELGVTPDVQKHPTPPAAEPFPAQLVRNDSTNMVSSGPKQAGVTNTALVSVPPQKPKEPLHDPEARAAMGLVGIDQDAEAYWLGAIFDASLPEGEREDLMEDLNEEGLSDAKHPGPQDLPVILNRLAIIEEILPFADQFMVEHLGEAYKDLINLAEITQGRGEPVR